MNKTKISKSNYVAIVWVIMALGILGNIIFSTIGNFYGFNYYSASFMAISTLVLGFGVGLAYARSWKINGIDN